MWRRPVSLGSQHLRQTLSRAGQVCSGPHTSPLSELPALSLLSSILIICLSLSLSRREPPGAARHSRRCCLGPPRCCKHEPPPHMVAATTRHRHHGCCKGGHPVMEARRTDAAIASAAATTAPSSSSLLRIHRCKGPRMLQSHGRDAVREATGGTA